MRLSIAEAVKMHALPAKGRAKRPTRDSSAEDGFALQCKAMNLPPVIRQWKLPRADGKTTAKQGRIATWVFDFCFLEQRLIVEISGGIWIRGAHSHPLDITRNMTKQNDAALAAFFLLEFTPEQVKSGHAITTTGIMLRKLPLIWGGILT